MLLTSYLSCHAEWHCFYHDIIYWSPFHDVCSLISFHLFQCDLCTYKTDTLHKLSIHQEIHSDNRPYTCDVCGKGFKQLSQMKNHQITHAQHQQNVQGGWFSAKPCEICKRTFANSKCLKKHVEAVHTKVKRFACTYCSHTTARKAMLNLHMRIHTGEKPFKWV